jgi:nucleotide-binding universal stress UspA family protein
VGAALVAAAADAGAAVVVVGSRGRSAVKELLLGSVAMAVLHAARGPVLVVPSRS